MPFADDEVVDMIWQAMNEHEGPISKEMLVKHLKTPPHFTIIRVNTVTTSKEILRDEIEEALSMQYSIKMISPPVVQFHPKVHDILVVKSNHAIEKVEPIYPHVMVGLGCAIAILRGANAYSPGITAIPNGVVIGDKVSVFGDLLGQCKRGWNKEYEGKKYFVGNGLLLQNRQDLFSVGVPKGLAINMIEPLFYCPSIGDILLDNKTIGFQKGFLQNLPSVLCGHALNPQPHHLVLDLCAAPGGKTTHIGSLMENKGSVIALDKSASKIKQIQENSAKLGLTNITAFVQDSTTACIMEKPEHLQEYETTAAASLQTSPPFLPNSFDRILLDAPCSALGQRPQLYNPIRLKEVQSFARLQKKLFLTAAQLLRPGGRMVYSTCTYNIAENEEIIDWALGLFPSLRVTNFNIQIGKPGYRIGRLTEEDCIAMQRFGSPNESVSMDENSDTIGFFICCLEKILS
ncbi:tRNA (cytosine(72)-C(5))-methyltransferase NSUN6-like isoform X1 [Daphnia pulex]|uniref:tRNA (cytosine(72)-C(5))-methyltransferase NSUN6-like isoform X1 n=2 Tax=Daphnia pulex TaxID=6669 RepID=UPI001EDFEB49|nr:tRNA (cytosine(72)-C(5))-methyltransferase NSUN6-like isoform X1 [Daphnia pulex]